MAVVGERHLVPWHGRILSVDLLQGDPAIGIPPKNRMATRQTAQALYAVESETFLLDRAGLDIELDVALRH